MREKDGVSVDDDVEIGNANNAERAFSPSQTHSVHRELPGGLVHEHQNLQEQVVGQVGEGELVGGSGSGSSGVYGHQLARVGA